MSRLDVDAVAEVQGEEAANALLKAGWRMIAVSRQKNGGVVYSLGRPRGKVREREGLRLPEFIGTEASWRRLDATLKRLIRQQREANHDSERIAQEVRERLLADFSAHLDGVSETLRQRLGPEVSS